MEPVHITININITPQGVEFDTDDDDEECEDDEPTMFLVKS